jgi:hypothetical protein
MENAIHISAQKKKIHINETLEISMAEVQQFAT